MSNGGNSLEPLLTIAAAARLLHVAPKTLYQYINQQKVPAYTLPGGEHIRVRLSECLSPYTPGVAVKGFALRRKNKQTNESASE
jgi:excisionase family DNA binding protein